MLNVPRNDDDDDGPCHFVQVGQTLIRVSDEQFQRGYQYGYDDFCSWWAKQRLTDGTLYIMLSMSITCPAWPEFANAGYIVGWVAALLESQPRRAADSGPDDPAPKQPEQKGEGEHAPDLVHGPC